MIYLDNAATTPVLDEVTEVIIESLREDFGNPSSVYKIGKKSQQLLRQAREDLANLLQISSQDIYFTSGATEANNWAIRSQAYQAKRLGYGNHIVSTGIEHPAVAKVTDELAKLGFEISYIFPNEDGKINIDDFIEASHDQTIGWIAMAVNNEVGSILPVWELGKLAKERGYWFHCDTVQAIGKIPWNYRDFPCTSFVATGHKFHAPKGIGFLVYRPFDDKMLLQSQIVGGGQEMGMRSGTENLAYIRGMVMALEISINQLSESQDHYQNLSNELLNQLNSHQIAFEVNGDLEDKVPHITSLWLKDQAASQLLIKLDLRDIYVSAGSACSAGSIQASSILKAYYPDNPKRWQESLRISYGSDTQMEDIQRFAEVIAQIVKK